MSQFAVNPAVKPELDPGFVPAALWNKAYRAAVAADPEKSEIVIALERSNGAVSTYRTAIFPHRGDKAALNRKYVERIVKFLLWMKGGYRVTIAGCEALAGELAEIYSSGGARAFDYDFMGDRVYGKTFEVVARPLAQAPESREIQVQLGGHLDGCRVGFDLGGSDRKCAAVIDGKVVHTEEVVWDPYFQKDPAYHAAGIRERRVEALPDKILSLRFKVPVQPDVLVGT